MKKIFFIVLLFCSSLFLNAQSYEEALKQAQVENKVLVIQFSGTDWCSPCIRLENEILDKEEFQTYKQNFVWLKADFPRKKENRLSKEMQVQNDALAEKFNQRGAFPLLVFVGNDEKVLGSIAYQRLEPKEYISLIKKIVTP